MGTAISREAVIKNALLSSALTEELRDAEIETLSRMVELCEFKAGEAIAHEDAGDAMRDTLMVLGGGEVEVTFHARGEAATWRLSTPGELGSIFGFVGGDVLQVSVGMVAKTDCSLLMLNRLRFEALLNSHPAIVYYVMRGVTRYVHGIVRRLNMRTMEMSNYLYFARHAPRVGV